MVTDALWTDFDKDGWKDIIITGEFMPVMFFKNENGKKFKLTNNYLPGYYFSLSEGDFDKDGDMDYVVGNIGLNSKFQVSDKEPYSVYAKDLDNNGRIEIFLSYFLNHRECAVAGRDMLSLQYPLIKKKFPDYGSFANANFDKILNENERNGAYTLHASNFASIYFENNGSGKFIIRQLDIKAQFSAIQAMICKDFDNDGNLDILVAGNFYSPDFITGRYDGSIGLLLKGNGKGYFSPLTTKKSGIFLEGDVRSIAPIKIMGSKCWLIGVNKGKLKVLKSK